MTELERVADRLRHLAADTERKSNSEEELDQGYIMEDLLKRLLDLANELDMKAANEDLAVFQVGPAAYELEDRASFGNLTQEG